MGQFCIIQSEDAEERSRVSARAASLFAALSGLKPEAQWSSGDAQLMLFASRHGGPPAVLESVHGRNALAVVGTCFYAGKSGVSGLRALATRLDTEDREWESALKDIDGCFVVIRTDADQRHITMITDLLGSLHVYVARQGACIAVSTSALVLAALFERPWNPVACREFLATGTVFETRSLFEGVEKLGPASVFEMDRAGLKRLTTYWDLSSVMYDRAPRRGDVPSLAESLCEAVGTVLGAFRRAVLDLTGGFDSRAILGAALKTSGAWETVVVGSHDDPDVQTANMIAAKFKLRHRHQNLPEDWDLNWWSRAKTALPLCDGECNILEYARVLEHHEKLAGEFDLSVNGSGGEICKGYWWELLYPFLGRRGHFDERRVAAGRFAFAPAGADLLSSRFDDDIVDHFAGIIRRANAGFGDHPNTAKMDNVYLTLRMQRWQGRIASSTMRIWPCISPFLMRGPMEAALSAPPPLRVRHRMSRRLIEHFDPKLAALPLAQGYPALPLRPGTAVHFWPLVAEFGLKAAGRIRKAISRSAVSVTPAENGIRRFVEANEEVREMLRPEGMSTRDLYDETRIRSFLAGSLDANQFGRVLTLEMVGRAMDRASSLTEDQVRCERL